MPILEPSQKIPARGVSRPARVRIPEIQAHLDDPRWQLARRIADSGGLGRSRLLTSFLLFIVDRYIRSRTEEITEQQIGILVFGREEGYDPNDDNIVRSYARTLRKRIDEYFATEGRAEPLLLEIPRGGYTPAFTARPSEIEPATPLPETIADAVGLPESSTHESAPKLRLEKWPSFRGAFHRYRAFLILGAGVLLGVAITAIRPFHLSMRALDSPDQVASAGLWSTLFSADRDTFIVPSDGGLVVMQRLVERPVPLERYVNGSYWTEVKTETDPGAAELVKLGRRRFTSVVDLDFVAHLAQLHEVVPSRMVVRYCRDLRMDDLRGGNAILVGSVEANPWIELFESQMSFRQVINVGTDKPSGMLNVHPRPGEATIYGTPGPDHTYGVIAYLPNLTSTGHVLIVGGLNTAGTEAATTFLLTPSLMLPVLEHAKTANGGLDKFEVLVGAGNVATNASAPQEILERIGLP